MAVGLETEQAAIFSSTCPCEFFVSESKSGLKGSQLGKEHRFIFPISFQFRDHIGVEKEDECIHLIRGLLKLSPYFPPQKN